MNGDLHFLDGIIPGVAIAAFPTPCRSWNGIWLWWCGGPRNWRDPRPDLLPHAAHGGVSVERNDLAMCAHAWC